MQLIRQIIILLWLIIQAWHLNAQTSVPILDRRVTIKITSQPLGKVLNIISETAGFNFSYGNQIKVNRLVTIHAENRSVEEVLDQLFNNEISYQQIGNHLILQKKLLPKNNNHIQESSKKPTKYNYIINGYIRDLYLGNGITNVSIYEKQSLSTTLSGDFGYYRLAVTSKEPEISIRYSLQNFDDTTLVIKFENNGSIAMNINLRNPNYRPPQIDTPVIETDSIAKMAVDTTQPKTPNKLSTILAWQDGKMNIRESQIGKWFINKYQKIAENNIRDSFFRDWQFTLVPPVSSNKTLSGLVTNKVSLNLLVGYNGGVNGMEAGGLLNIVKGEMRGVQFAGLGNIVGGETRGVQFAGLFNHNLDRFNGFQATGLYNFHIADAEGIQTAGLFNINKGRFEGFQAAGLINYVADGAEGMEIAGLMNINEGYLNGLQTSGLINVARDVDGGQISGLVNIAKNVNGFQLSFINVADTNTGVAIGFVNFIKSGIHQMEISRNEEAQYTLAYRSGTRKLYSVLFATSRMPIGDSNTLLSYGWGVGTSIKLLKPLRLTMEATSQQLTFDFNTTHLTLLNKLSANLEFKLFKGCAVFGGASLNYLIADMANPHFNSTFADFGTKSFFNERENTFDLHGWIGYQFGLRLF